MSTIIDEVPRHPAGTPASRGGEFAARQLTDPEGTLAEDAAGSFIYPPDHFDSFREFAEFWESAPISDRVLSNASHAYRTWLQSAEDAAVRGNWHQYEEGNEKTERMLQRKLGAGSKDLNLESRGQVIADFRAKLPARVSPRHMRQVLRAYQMGQLVSSILDRAEQDGLDTYTFTVDDEQLTGAQLEDLYHPSMWAERALTEADLPVVDSLRYLAQATDQRDGYETGDPVVSPY